MTQEFKSIEEIKEEYAIELGYPDWHSFYQIFVFRVGSLENHENKIEIRYLQQFKSEAENFRKGFEVLQEAVLKSAERNKELVEMLEQMLRYSETYNQDVREEAEMLINKYKSDEQENQI